MLFEFMNSNAVIFLILTSPITKTNVNAKTFFIFLLFFCIKVAL